MRIKVNNWNNAPKLAIHTYMAYSMTQWYVFQELTEAATLRIQAALASLGKDNDMNGLILVAREGCNGTVAGSPTAIETIKSFLRGEFADLPFQDWHSEKKPFRRFKVDIRQEIVALKKNGTPAPSGQGHASPQEFHAMMQEKNVTVLDTRNWYETALGTFKNAVVPPLTSFQEFPEFVAHSNIPKEQPVLMYCTSGIRCEKAAEEMRSQGYKNVYQLDGGITNYIKQYPDGLWQGECFVFDHRVAVDTHLQPSQKYSLCPMCGNPGDVHTTCATCNTDCTVCALCLSKTKAACSKRCKK